MSVAAQGETAATPIAHAGAVRLDGVAAALIVLSIVPVWLAQRLSGDTASGRF